MKKPLILVDGSSYFFRAFHALPPLVNSKGLATGAIFGVTNMIKRLLKDYDPERIAVVFDASGKTFRDDWYPLYKAHRQSMPEALSDQFFYLRDLLEAMGLPVLIIEGVEADDVIGTLALAASKEGYPVLISSSDKDMIQLVNPHVALINTMSNQYLDVEGVKEKYGLHPEQFVDYLTLMGDSIDNVPGVKNCGPKTATKWLQNYGSLDEVVLAAENISGKIGIYLRESLPHLPLSKKLVTIKTDVSLPFSFLDLNRVLPRKEILAELISLLEFRSWLKELQNEKDSNALPADFPKVQLIQTEEDFQDFLNLLQEKEVLCLDAETTSLDARSASLVGLAFAFEGHKGFYLPLTHQDGSQQLNKATVLSVLKPLLESPKIKKIGHNLKYDYVVLKNEGITLQGIEDDTMLASYLLNSSSTRHNLDALASKYLAYQTISYEEVAGKGIKQVCFDQVPLEKAAPYAAEDAAITWRLHDKLSPLLPESLLKLLMEIEIPLSTILAQMEWHGVLIDTQVLAEHGTRLKKRIFQLEEEIFALAERPFNIQSPKQLQEILYDHHQLPVIAKTPKGQASTAEAVLQELAFSYPLPARILEYRSLSKLVSTYIDALPRRVNPQTQRVHTSYNQAVAATGRLSSSEPNLQNIPIRNEEGRLIRKAFIAPAGYRILAADYSQIELRIMAHLSKEPNLLKAFQQGLDIHLATAAEIFHVPLEEVSAEQRRRAKAVNFGLIYGMSAFGLAKQLGIDRQDAQSYIDTYFKRYPLVLTYMEETRQAARSQGYVETILGRRLYLPDIHAAKLSRQRAAERMAINAPMQGSAADIIKKAMILIADWQAAQAPGEVTMIMQVHDELVFEVKEAFAEKAAKRIRSLMEDAVTLTVPLLVSLGLGANWDEAH